MWIARRDVFCLAGGRGAGTTVAMRLAARWARVLERPARAAVPVAKETEEAMANAIGGRDWERRGLSAMAALGHHYH